MGDWLRRLSEPGGGGVLEGILAGVGVLGLLFGMIWISRWRDGGHKPRGRDPGRKRVRLLADFMLVGGSGCLLIAAGLYFTDSSDSGAVLPRPVVLAGSEIASVTPTSTAVVAAMASETSVGFGTIELTSTETATATPVPTSTQTPTVTPTPVTPGVPVRLRIPSIGVDSKVEEAGTYWDNGELFWETLPFLVAYYKTTAQAGENGNSVYSGHVTSRAAGNVFAELYRVKLGDEVHIYTDENEFTYVVTSVREVLPNDVSVMDPTPDATVTLITCSGTWIPNRHEYDHRLIVSAKLRR